MNKEEKQTYVRKILLIYVEGGCNICVWNFERVFLLVGGMFMDYKKMILDLLEKVNDVELLRRVYKFLEYLYIYKEKETGI